jgi:hypothetical protein
MSEPVHIREAIREYWESLETREPSAPDNQMPGDPKRVDQHFSPEKDGYEHRWVDCEITLNMTTCRALVTRKDTGEIVEDRPMSPDEKQLQIEFEEDKT